MQKIIRRAVWVGCALALVAAPVGAQDATKLMQQVHVPQVSQESVKKIATEGTVVRSSTTLGGPKTVSVGSVTWHHSGGRVH